MTYTGHNYTVAGVGTTE